jgi:hypothetical protein
MIQALALRLPLLYNTDHLIIWVNDNAILTPTTSAPCHWYLCLLYLHLWQHLYWHSIRWAYTLGLEQPFFDYMMVLGTTMHIAHLVHSPLLTVLIVLSNESSKRLTSRPSHLDCPMHCATLCLYVQHCNYHLAFNTFFLVQCWAACHW